MARLYQQDSDGLNEIARSPAVRAALKAVAEKAKAIAEGLSADFTVTGDYASSFRVEEDTIEWPYKYPGRRAAAYLINDSDHAVAVEWGYMGTAKNPTETSAHHVLGRTLGMLK